MFSRPWRSYCSTYSTLGSTVSWDILPQSSQSCSKRRRGSKVLCRGVLSITHHFPYTFHFNPEDGGSMFLGNVWEQNTVSELSRPAFRTQFTVGVDMWHAVRGFTRHALAENQFIDSRYCRSSITYQHTRHCIHTRFNASCVHWRFQGPTCLNRSLLKAASGEPEKQVILQSLNLI
jgi:hypothetical protein